jgi:Sec-independent protein translocase protein TatA
MSSGQFLLTLGVAHLVFDSKKLPKLIENVAYLFVRCRQYYHDGVMSFERILQQAVLEKQLEQNEQKAQAVDIPSTDEF